MISNAISMSISEISLVIYSFINISKSKSVFTDFSLLFSNLETIIALKMTSNFDIKSLS